MTVVHRRRIPYIPNRSLYKDYYRASGGGGLPVFRGIHQDGSGLLGNIFRFAMPLVKSAGKTLLKSGAEALSDVVSGEKDIKSALKERGLQGLQQVGRNVTGRLLGALDDGATREQQGGRRRRYSKRSTRTTVAAKGRKRKQRETDIFDNELLSPPVTPACKRKNCRSY